MHREQAERLLAALIFDDLDETSKTELLAYLETDDELRDRLADMRMAVKVTSDSVKQGPEPVLGRERVKRLASLARGPRARLRIFTVRRLAAAAAIILVGMGLLIPHLGRSRRTTALSHAATAVAFRRAASATVAVAPSKPSPADEKEALGLPGLAGSEGKRLAEVDEGGGQYAASSGVGHNRVDAQADSDVKERTLLEEIRESQMLAVAVRPDAMLVLGDSATLPRVEDKAGKPTTHCLGLRRRWRRTCMGLQGSSLRSTVRSASRTPSYPPLAALRPATRRPRCRPLQPPAWR